MNPRSLEEAKTYRYGEWPGNVKGVRFDPLYCFIEVWPKSRWISRQCSRKAGPDGLCTIHRKKAEKEKG